MRRTGGFTLLEVAIALLITGLALAALYRGAGDGLTATALSVKYDEAIVRAKSHLALAVNGGRLAAGTFEGDDGGGFHWVLRVAPIQTASVRTLRLAGLRAASSQPLVLYSVSTAISWREGASRRQVVLTTEQVGIP